MILRLRMAKAMQCAIGMKLANSSTLDSLIATVIIVQYLLHARPRHRWSKTYVVTTLYVCRHKYELQPARKHFLCVLICKTL